jgi:hypothetical protein
MTAIAICCLPFIVLTGFFLVGLCFFDIFCSPGGLFYSENQHTAPTSFVNNWRLCSTPREMNNHGVGAGMRVRVGDGLFVGVGVNVGACVFCGVKVGVMLGVQLAVGVFDGV